VVEKSEICIWCTLRTALKCLVDASRCEARVVLSFTCSLPRPSGPTVHTTRSESMSTSRNSASAISQLMLKLPCYPLYSASLRLLWDMASPQRVSAELVATANLRRMSPEVVVLIVDDRVFKLLQSKLSSPVVVPWLSFRQYHNGRQFQGHYHWGRPGR
jgi:hypothetical protein